MSADRSEVVLDQHWSLLLRSARCSPFRLRPNAGHDVGRNRSCSAVLPQHFIHVLPGREHFSEASTTTRMRCPGNAPVLNRTKSETVNFCTTAECYESIFRLSAAGIHFRTSGRMRNRRPGGRARAGPSLSGHLGHVTRTGHAESTKRQSLGAQGRSGTCAGALGGGRRVADREGDRAGGERVGERGTRGSRCQRS